MEIDVLADICEAEDTDNEEDEDDNVEDGEAPCEDPRIDCAAIPRGKCGDVVGGGNLRLRRCRREHELGESTVNDGDENDDFDADDTRNRCLGDA
ncbi:unnamed protein product [Hydatigera taeniaeformis]|uniref:Uncharacterized protein n=1 Tax=Hydatigena taeniaeformis TaxID=6205 RepID=A0A0R3WP44_HYDTA|nr:unnamed protein product [Hydatigera taeniaeformis]